MKINKTIKVLCGIFILTSFSCAQDEQLKNEDVSFCNSEINTVKKVKDRIGRISYFEEEKKWMIIASNSGTYDSQDLGILCNDFPDEIKIVGIQVQFSGEYKEIEGESKGVLPGQVIYYLFVNDISRLNDN